MELVGVILVRRVWGLLRSRKAENEISGGELSTTNSRMVLTSAIRGLLVLERASRVALATDSQYVRRSNIQWIKGCNAKG